MDFSHYTPQLPFLGYGLGLRPTYYEEIINEKPQVDWFEIITENYLGAGGKPLSCLDVIRADYPLTMHGVSLSLGSIDPIDMRYLSQVKELACRIEPVWISDHLCWTGIDGINLHDLLPMPYTREAIRHLISRIHQVQDFLKRPLLIENVSSYLAYEESEMSEWEFINTIVNQTGCFILLDVNNVYVSAANHRFDPLDYIKAMSPHHVVQIHLAGHTHREGFLIDTHDVPIAPAVWELYAATICHLGKISTLVERDANMPPLLELLDELHKARYLSELALAEYT